jgi:hypothetical protein
LVETETNGGETGSFEDNLAEAMRLSLLEEEQRKKREEDTEQINQGLDSIEKLREILKNLPGVDCQDERFNDLIPRAP